MFSFLTRPRCARRVAEQRSVRPRLECLEERDCPSALTLGDSFDVGNHVIFGGKYSNTMNVANQLVTLTGNGWSAGAVTDSLGNWHVSVPITATEFGSVTASVADPACNQPQVTITKPAAPTITGFTATVRLYGFWEFQGTVTGTPNPYGMTVTFGGIPALVNQTTTLNANGVFDVSFQLNGQIGTASAITTDWWGQTSAYAYAVVG